MFCILLPNIKKLKCFIEFTNTNFLVFLFLNFIWLFTIFFCGVFLVQKYTLRSWWRRTIFWTKRFCCNVWLCCDAVFISFLFQKTQKITQIWKEIKEFKGNQWIREFNSSAHDFLSLSLSISRFPYFYHQNILFLCFY